MSPQGVPVEEFRHKIRIQRLTFRELNYETAILSVVMEEIDYGLNFMLHKQQRLDGVGL